MKKRNWIIVISVLLNIVLMAGLTQIVIQENYCSKLLRRISTFKNGPTPVYLLDWYRAINDSFSVYEGQKNVVMLGDSHTSMVNWSELLGRGDVASRGIERDITEGFIRRINSIIDLKPKFCFIQGGLNDLYLGFSKEYIINNLQILIDTLYQNNIKSSLTTVTFVSKEKNGKMPINDKVKELNELIFQLAKKNNIPLIDLNGKLSDGDYLGDEYSAPDGLHFSNKSYQFWKNTVLDILNIEQLLW